MTLQEMKQMKQEHGYSDSHIAELSGIPVETIQKIFEGQTEGIGYHIWQAVEDVFVDKRMMREGAAAYGVPKKQGSYTVEDYRALPDERRVELIDG